MLRGFLLIFVLASICHRGDAAVFAENIAPAHRGKFSPIWCGSKKMRAQSPIDFSRDGRGPRLPIASTVPIGYESPMPQAKALPEIPPTANARAGPASKLASASARALIITTPARWGTIGVRAFQFRSRNSSCSVGSSVSISTVPFVMV